MYESVHRIPLGRDDSHYFVTMSRRRLSRIVLVALTLAPLPGIAGHGVGGGFGGGPPSWAAGAAGPLGARGILADPAGLRGASSAAEARNAQMHELRRAHPDRLEFDPQDQLVVRDEIVAVAPSASALDGARSQGFTVRRQQVLNSLGLEVFILTPPHGLSARRALKRLRASDPEGGYDYNHIYFQSGSIRLSTAFPHAAGVGPASESLPKAGTVLRIGLVDGGVEASHSALHGLTVRAHGCDGTPRPSPHGTAVASLLPGQLAESERVELYAADVYCGEPTGGAVDALSEAIAWLVDQRVAVINVSLVGPPNALLQRVVQIATERGHLIVAAVGNDGPAAPPLYPAAYPGVVAVTGVDRNNKVLVEAERGPYVHFAAPGADIEAARLPEGSADIRGTSFASPTVAALLAARLARPDRVRAAEALHELEAQALDLGAPGFDPVYGYGCLGCESTQPQTAATHRAP